MFDRLGKRQELAPVTATATYRTQTFLLWSEADAESDPCEATEKPAEQKKAVSVETEKIVNAFVTAQMSRPLKKLRRDLNVPKLTDRFPLQENRVSPALSQKYVAVFEKMHLGGPGFSVPKGFGRTASLFLRRWLDINGLQGRPLVQFWPDADMVFWVRGDGTTHPSVE